MPPPQRRVTDTLRAVLRVLFDEDDALPVTRTAGDVAMHANISQSTAGDVLARLHGDGHLRADLTPRGDRSRRLIARPIRTYTLTDTGVTYARAVLGRAGVPVPGGQPS